MYAVAFKSQDNKQLDLSVIGDAGYALILPWMPVPVSMITLTQVVSGSSTVVARAAIGREIPDLKHLALTVDGTTAKVYFRGHLLMVGTLSTTMTIDRVELQGGTKDTLLSEMLLMPRVAEPEDIAMWHNLRAPFYDPSPHIPAEHQPVTVKGAGADIDIDKYGIRATRKTDGKKTFEIDAETGDVHFEGDGVFRGRVEASEGYFHGRVEAEEGYFRGDITGASGTFSGNLSAERVMAGIIEAGGIGADHIQTGSIRADMYYEIRNVMPYNYSDSLDDSKPLECDFYIPTETTRLVSIKLSARGLPYRAYSRSAALRDVFGQETSGGGAHAHDIDSIIGAQLSTSSDGAASAHSHSFQETIPAGYTGSAGSHSHNLSYDIWAYTSTDSTPSHNHRYDRANGASSAGAHEHTVSTTTASRNTGSAGAISSHSHTVRVGIKSVGGHTHTISFSHTHDLVFGIYEGTVPAGVKLYCDNGSGYDAGQDLATAPSLCTELDLTNKFTGTGWKRIKFTSNRLGRIVAALIVKVDVSA